MTTLRGSSSADVEAGVDRCWTVLADVDRWAEWTSGLDQVVVIDRDDDGRVTVCETVNDAKVKKVKARVAITYEPPRRLSFSLLHSALMRAMEGAWTLEALGPERTRATFEAPLHVPWVK
jgi:hypothetical protein